MMKLFIPLLLLLAGCTGEPRQTTSVLTDTSVHDSLPMRLPVDSVATAAIRPVVFNTGPIKVAYDSHEVVLPSGTRFSVAVLKGFDLYVAAKGLKRLRFLAMSPDKRLFATDMHDRSDNNKGRVLIFEDWIDSSRSFGKITTYLSGLHNPNQVAFYKGFIYVAETDKLTRYPYLAGDSIPREKGEVIARFPAYGLSYKYGGWHLTRSLAFHGNKLYVSVGSSCNACIEREPVRASVIEMDADGSRQRLYATGLRNSVGIKWIGGRLWGTGMGRDLIGPDKPEDLFQEIVDGGYYGWPFYFQYNGKIYEDEQFRDSARPAGVKPPPLAFAFFRAHSAPLGFEYLENFEDTLLRNSVLVCLHGSTSVWRQRGNSIVRLEGGGKYTEVVGGFLQGKTEDKRYGRPCDILKNNNRSFFFTDDLNGMLYYVEMR